MSNIVAVTACPTGIAHTVMAAEALRKTAAVLGHRIAVETQGSDGTKNALAPDAVAAADVVILAVDIGVPSERFAGKPVFRTSTSTAIRDTKNVINEAVALAGNTAPAAQPAAHTAPSAATQPAGAAVYSAPPAAVANAPTANASAPATASAPAATASDSPKRLVGITSCPTGIAHTFMAAKALENAAKALGHQIKVETQGSVGAKNIITAEDVEAADAVVIAADTKVDLSRFAGKPIYLTGTNDAINGGQDVIKAALAQPVEASAGLGAQVEQLKAQRSSQRTGPYKHLMTGVSYMLPFVVAGGLLTALAFALGGYEVASDSGTFAGNLKLIAEAAFGLFVGALSAFIAFSIADRPGIVPGFVGGILAGQIGAGFLGGIAAGFIAGYLTKFLNDNIDLGENLNGLKPVLILPLLATSIVGLLLIYIIGPPVAAILGAMTAWLTSMQSSGAIVVGLILGLMMAFDMGGPVNKAAYTVAVGLIASDIYGPMAAVMAAGMTPPLGLAVATWLFRDRFDDEERKASPSAFVLGLAFITEGAIPYAAKDPFRVIPSLMIGSAVAGAISMAAGCGLRVPHGGIFVTPFITNIGMYIVALLAGTAVTIGALYVLKRPLSRQPAAVSPPIAEPTTGPATV